MENLIGKTIKILCMSGEPHYTGRIGTVKYIDDANQLHGTWGGLAVNPAADTFKVLLEVENESYYSSR